MKISKLAGALMLGCALAATFSAHAEGVDWNDQLTREVLSERGIESDDYTAAMLLQTELYVKSERLSRSGVDVLKRRKEIPGVAPLTGSGNPQGGEFPEYVKVVAVQNPDGSTVLLAKELSPQEVEQLKLETAGTTREAVAAEMSLMSDGLMMLGGALRQGIGNSNFAELLGNESGTAEVIATGGGQKMCEVYFDSMATIYDNLDSTEKSRQVADMHMQGMMGPDGKLYPITYVLGPACMLAGSARELEALPEGSSPEAYAKAHDDTLKAVNKAAKMRGDETVDGHTTKRIDIEKVSLKQTMDDGSEVTINNVSIWLDPDYYVRRRIRMEGTMKRGRKSEPFFMERENQDYRRVGETYLYEPYREVMKVGGIMSDKDKRELAKAKKELESAKQQLAQMPASQRAMMEGMFASQMAQLESLVNNGAATVEVITTDIEINPGFADTMVTTFGGSSHSETLVRLIQTDLAKLGFEPGPVTGKINKATSDAISAYQASRNMTVNGSPSPELATALRADVDGL
jgi:hypothetical protein